MSFIAVYITNDSKESAQRLADTLLADRLIACANIFPISASYHWMGDIAQENEWVALVKTTKTNWIRLKEKVSQIHPYDIPCIMKIDVEANEAYEQWIRQSVR
ncbi:MAG TPA: divalent-cation tolerance protein CutA [Saprospiraceae bacterium]|nr:divalent-cation tolerance protein CutA [Saprospiraceae bacterium]